MIFFYSIVIFMYGFILKVAALFNRKAKKMLAGRKSTRHIYQNWRKNHAAPLIWFHCASVGEFEQALPLYHELNKTLDNHEFIFSFYSPSGYEFAQKKHPDLSIFYLPLDTASHMREVVEGLQPKWVIIIKYEFWLNLLTILNKHTIKVFLVCGIFRPGQVFFSPWLGRFFKRMLEKFTHLLVQNEKSKVLLESIGIHSVTVTGDTRIDRVIQNKHADFSDPVIKSFIGQSKVFVGGSVWESDTEVLQQIITHLPADYKIILAPHEINHFDTQWIPGRYCLYTQFKNEDCRILILDTTGLLSRIYRYAELSYVGGGFGKGLHNILEPAVFGKPIIIGKAYTKFNEAVELVEVGAVYPVQSSENLESLTITLTQDLAKRGDISDQLHSYFAKRANISQKIAVLINEHG